MKYWSAVKLEIYKWNKNGKFIKYTMNLVSSGIIEYVKIIRKYEMKLFHQMLC